MFAKQHMLTPLTQKAMDYVVLDCLSLPLVNNFVLLNNSHCCSTVLSGRAAKLFSANRISSCGSHGNSFVILLLHGYHVVSADYNGC